MFGRSLALLQQAEAILKDQLSDIDLHQLRADTAASRAGGSRLSASATQRWSEVLVAVSPTLYDFGREMMRVHQYLERRRKSLRMMQRIVWSLEAMVILLAFVSIAAAMQGASGGDSAATAVSVGMVIGLTLFMFASLGSWLTMLNEMNRNVSFQQNSPLHSAMLRFSDRLSSKFIVVFAAAILTGRDVSRDVANFIVESKQNQQNALTWASCAGAGAPRPLPSCVFSGLTACSVRSTYTIAQLDRYVRVYCPTYLVDMADGMIDLVDNGTDRFARPQLWSTVDAGVNALRRLVLTEFDDALLSDSQPTYTPDVVETVVREELAPVLQMRGLELPYAFDRSDANTDAALAASGMSRGALAVLDESGGPPTDFGAAGALPGPDDEALCFRSCMSSPHCKVAFFRPPATGVASPTPGACFVADSYKPIGEGGSFAYNVGGPGAGSASLYVARGATAAEKLTLCAKDGSQVQQVLAMIPGGAAANLCATGAANAFLGNSTSAMAAVASSTMLDQATYLAAQLVVVLRRHRFVLKLADVRPQLDAELAAFYGADVYAKAISPAVDLVVQRATDLALAERRNPSAFVDADRLVDKLSNMAAQDAGALHLALSDMRTAAVKHRDMFPLYRRVSTARVAKIVVFLGGMSLVTAFVCYVVVLYSMYTAVGRGSGQRAISYSTLVQRAVVGLCAFVITLFVLESMCTKVAANAGHNLDTIDANGEQLVAGTVRTVDLLEQLWLLIGRVAVQGHPAGFEGTPDADMANAPAHKRAVAAGFVAQAKLVIQTYDKCNSVTSAQITTPPPYSDLLMYGVVAGMFIVVTGLCVYRVAPGDKVGNLRMLYGLVRRVKEGDLTAVKEAQFLAECARPPVFIWSIFVWYGVMLLVVVTAWFVMASQMSMADYQESLDARTDCV